MTPQICGTAVKPALRPHMLLLATHGCTHHALCAVQLGAHALGAHLLWGTHGLLKSTALHFCASAVCAGPLPTLENGAFPSSCTGSKLGVACTAACNPGFTGGLFPVTTCQLKANSTDTAEWSTPVPLVCPKIVGLAFLLSQGDDSNQGAVSRGCGQVAA